MIKYKYYRNNECDITAATEIDKDKKKIIVGFAIRNPILDQFNKKLARMVSKGRLSNEKTSVVVDFPEGKSINEAVSEAWSVFVEKKSPGGRRYVHPRLADYGI